MSELPFGWAEATIGDLVRFNYGKGLPERERSGSGFPVFGSNGVVGYHGHVLVHAESLIVGRKGSVGEVHHAQGPCWPIDTTYFVDDFSCMPTRFWYYALKSLNLAGLNRATAIPGLNREDAYQVEFAFPPLNEQKRIADKLDTVLARVDACRERLDRVPAILKRFRQSVLAAATSGKLTEEWRAEWQASVNADARSEVRELIDVRRKASSGKRKFKELVQPNMTYWAMDVPENWSVESVSSFAECLDHLRVPVKRDARKNSQRLYPYYGANGQVDLVDEYLFDDELVLVTEDETFYGREKPIAYRVSGKCW